MSHLIISPIIAVARTYIGTPYHHQGRQPQIGLDCLGVVVCALRACGYSVNDQTDYTQSPNGAHMLASIRAHAVGERPRHYPPQAGDLLLFRFNQQPQHCALATGDGQMIHAYAPQGSVVESRLSASWQSRLLHIFYLKD